MKFYTLNVSVHLQVNLNFLQLLLSASLRGLTGHMLRLTEAIITHVSPSVKCVVAIIPNCQLKSAAYCLAVRPNLWDYVITAVMPEYSGCRRAHTYTQTLTHKHSHTNTHTHSHTLKLTYTQEQPAGKQMLCALQMF